MEKITLREYARRNKLSYFAVMKLVRNAKVKSETLSENGKDVEYILIDDKEELNNEISEKDTPQMSCEEENALLKEEIIRLKEALERCNRRTTLVL